MTPTPKSTHDDSPLVTVVVTTYNRPEYLRRAVETVVEQEYGPIELVVVDDCSERPASEVLADVSPDVAAFEIHRHEENLGANAARNTGVEAASGEFIAFLDDDDRWEPEKIGRQVETFAAAPPEVGLVYTGRKRVDVDVVRDVSQPVEITGDETQALLCRNAVGTQSAVMVRADIAKRIPFDERMPRWADLEWYVAVSTECSFAVIPEPLVLYEEAAHNRISDNYEPLIESHRLFVSKYRSLAATYGWRFERKMLGHAAYRVGSASLDARNYRNARRYFLWAVAWYPVEPKFWKYALATLGGRFTHRAAQAALTLADTLGSPDGREAVER